MYLFIRRSSVSRIYLDCKFDSIGYSIKLPTSIIWKEDQNNKQFDFGIAWLKSGFESSKIIVVK